MKHLNSIFRKQVIVVYKLFKYFFRSNKEMAINLQKKSPEIYVTCPTFNTLEDIKETKQMSVVASKTTSLEHKYGLSTLIDKLCNQGLSLGQALETTEKIYNERSVLIDSSNIFLMRKLWFYGFVIVKNNVVKFGRIFTSVIHPTMSYADMMVFINIHCKSEN